MRAVPLRQIMTAAVVSVTPATSVAEALEVLSERRISCLVVAEDGAPVGIVTERDIVKAYDGLDGHGDLPIARVMTAAPLTVSAELDHFEAFKLMKERRIRHLVVRTDDGHIGGVVTETDFVRHLGVDFYVRPKDVQSVMAPVVTATEDAPLADILAKLARPNIFCVVIERQDRAIGILTERDAVRLLRQHSPVGGLTAGQVMNQPLRTIAPTASLLEVSEAFRQHSIRHLVVVDEKGAPKGVVSEHEIVQGLESEYVVHLERIIVEKNEALAALGYAHEQLAEQSRELSGVVAELEASHEELHEFARAASHDLAEPSRLVVSFCQLLLKRHGEALGEEGRELAEFAIDGALRMRQLVHDLALYAAPTRAGDEPVDATAVARSVLEALGDEIEATEARVELAVLPELKLPRATLAELFRHLIGNALIYRRDDVEPHIRIGCDDDGEGWRLWVADNGIGIDSAYHEDIFHLFTRLHPAGSRSGTGAGLAICRRIVVAAGGRLWVESEPGKGSTFFIALPK
ncbi:MAG TPA: CBS domain-containing protein [Magnetospirillum sp.]|jgi:CBS domain-containing protein|nr:CBS domain-containing protein [Magnetospirillum sp.]